MVLFRFWKFIRYHILQLIYVWLDFIDVLFHSRNLTRILKEIPATAFLLVTDRYLIRVDKIAYAIQSIR